MVGYQACEGGDVETGTETREAQFSEAGIKDKAVEAVRTAAVSNPKIACVVFALLLIVGIHWFLALLPTLLFWFVLVPGAAICILYFLGIQIPSAISDRLPAALGGTAGA
mmetsp:Transcript_40905/g.83695  ORF Transcript_40905/g.83695 Transcript_40905/m.83695 type:complete len:110 (+) Transcript_40905:119-448(+)